MWDKIKNSASKFKGLTEIGIANISSSVISGFFWLYLATLLGTTHYGEVSYLLAIANIISNVASVGASNTIIVYTAKGEKIQSTIFLIIFVTAIVSSMISYIIYHDSGISAYVFGSLIFGLVLADLMGRKLYKDYSKYIVAQRILMVILVLLLYSVIGIQGIVLGYGLSFFPYLPKAYKQLRESKIDFSVLKPRKGFMITSYFFDLSRNVSVSTDKLIVAPLFGYALLGNYQLGIQFLTVLNMLPGIIYQYLLPQDASGNTNKALKNATILTSIGLAVLGIVLSPIVVPVLFPKFTDAVIIIQIVSVSVIPYTFNLTCISKLLGEGNSKIVLIGSLIYLFVQILTIIILGKIFGVNGIAASVVLATGVESIYLIIANHFVSKNSISSNKEMQ